MASVNKVILVGNLGRNPELRYTPDGAAVCSLSIATTNAWKDRNSGERREETEWHRVVLIGRLAEVAGEYLTKGQPVYFEGRLRTRKWTDRSGQDRYTTEVMADQMQMLGTRTDGAPQRASEPTQTRPQQSPSQIPQSASAAQPDDDVGRPF